MYSMNYITTVRTLRILKEAHLLLCFSTSHIHFCLCSITVMVLTLVQRMRIVFLIEDLNYSLAQAARAVRVSVQTVASFMKKYGRTGCFEPDYRAGSGRPPLLSLHERRLLNRASVAAPRASASQLAASLGGTFRQVSTRTVQRTLNNVGRWSYRPTQGPNLTVQQRAVRLAWARAHLGWSCQDWEKVSQLLIQII
jgi:transposase